MFRIPLNSKKYPGLYALVDIEAISKFPELTSRKWSPSMSRTLSDGSKLFYAVIKGSKNNKKYSILMHNLILQPSKGFVVDHIDHNGLNNMKSNIRLVSNTQNQYNRKQNRNGTSKYKGVCLASRNKKYLAQIRFEGKTYYIGSFENEIEAAKAYDKKAKELFKEFAYLNFKE